jgi:hypothetical protein
MQNYRTDASLRPVEEAKTHLKPKEDKSWQQCIETVQPVIEEEQSRLMKELNDVRANVKCAITNCVFFAVSQALANASVLPAHDSTPCDCRTQHQVVQCQGRACWRCFIRLLITLVMALLCGAYFST